MPRNTVKSRANKSASTRTEIDELKAELKALKANVATRNSRIQKKVGDRVLLEFQGWITDQLKPLLEQFEQNLQALEERLNKVEEDFSQNVKTVAEAVTMNLRESAFGANTPKHSGTLRSPLGRIVDEGISGPPLPGSFESSSR